MSKGIVVVVLIFVVLLVWFWIEGQALQSVEVAFVLGLIVGVLFGWWTGGYRVLRKQLKANIEKARTTFTKDKELL